MGAYQVHGLSKRESRVTALPIHDRNHQLRENGPDENKADRDKRGQRNTNPKPDTGFSLIAPGNKRHNECDTCNHDHSDENEPSERK